MSEDRNWVIPPRTAFTSVRGSAYVGDRDITYAFRLEDQVLGEAQITNALGPIVQDLGALGCLVTAGNTLKRKFAFRTSLVVHLAFAPDAWVAFSAVCVRRTRPTGNPDVTLIKLGDFAWLVEALAQWIKDSKQPQKRTTMSNIEEQIFGPRYLEPTNSRFSDYGRPYAPFMPFTMSIAAESVTGSRPSEMDSLRDEVKQLRASLQALENRLKTALQALQEKKQEQEAQAENPFASPLGDGKAQYDMFVSGLGKPRVRIDQVIVPQTIKDAVLATLTGNQEQLFDEWGFGDILEKGRGTTMLLAGLPGTGKTMMAEGIAHHLGYLFWNIGSGSLVGMFVGDFEKGVSAAFRKAKKVRGEWLAWSEREQNTRLTNENGEIVGHSDPDLPPEPPKGIVLLFDEADSIVAAREKASTTGPSWTMGPIASGQINHFLRELEEYDGVCVFATNRIGTLDAAFERRLSLILEFPFPDQAVRELIWRGKIPAKAPLGDDVDFAKLASYEFAGGHIKNAVLYAARLAQYEKASKIEMRHFLAGVKKVLEGQQTFSGQKPTSHAIMAVAPDDDNLRRLLYGIDNPGWN
jgi:hypothetical protein